MMATLQRIFEGLGTLSVVVVLPLVLWTVRRQPEWHLRVLQMGARFGRLYLFTTGVIVLGSGYIWFHTNASLHFWRWETAMWTYGISGVSLLAFGKLGTFRQGNAAMTWRNPAEAGMHITVSRLTAGETRSFMRTAPDLWMKARRLGFRQVRMFSPLLGDIERCHRFAEMMVEHALSKGLPCQVEYIEPQTWNWFMSLLYFLHHDRKTQCPQKLAMPWHQRVFQVRVGGFRLLFANQ